MTSRISASGKFVQRPVAAHRRGGFTLIEILVVVGIVLVLAGLLLPAITKAYKQAQRTSMASDLQAVATALDAYKKDYGVYPLVRTEAGTTPTVDRPNPMTGAQILCFALVGPAQATENPTPAAGQRPKQDGLDGPGFRVLRLPGNVLNTTPAKPSYLSETFRYGDPMDPMSPGQVSHDEANVLRFTLLDRNNKPILYFPASPAKTNIRPLAAPPATEPRPYVDSALVSSVPQSETSKYDADDNLVWFTDDPTAYAATVTLTSNPDMAKALKRIRVMLGDVMGFGETPSTTPTTPDGVIQQYETAVEQPYLIWGAGPDERFGPGTDLSTGATLSQTDRALFDKCDDVTNFRQ